MLVMVSMTKNFPQNKEFINTFVKYRYLEKAAKVVISNK
jgi:hypothetical protein